MPPKYHIDTLPTPGRFPRLSHSGVIAWEEGCLKCVRCAKKQCVYKVYEERKLHPQHMRDKLDYECRSCFRCVQSCPKGLIHKTQDPRYLAIGDDYWTPEVISSIWYQAETGRIPVSGAGYGGPFSGPGFDSMWTDMSEIVRPTRDGIHGREYISTAVDLGRKPMALSFDEQGRLACEVFPVVGIPLPVILDVPPWQPTSSNITEAILRGARELGTLAIVNWEEWNGRFDPFQDQAVIRIEGDQGGLPFWLSEGCHIIEVEEPPELSSTQAKAKGFNPDLIVMIRVGLRKGVERRVLDLVKEGAEIIHLKADHRGRESGEGSRFILDSVRQVHFTLVEAGLRDSVTLVAGGGVALAEHMCKLIICGADAVSVDLSLLVAMECRVCGRCKQGIQCPVEIGNADPRWGASRMRNLLGAWHSQLLEVMGAMGMRDVRRLRGEMGRAMFFDELEREFFSSLGRRG